jgi:hypothetical protein
MILALKGLCNCLALSGRSSGFSVSPGAARSYFVFAFQAIFCGFGFMLTPRLPDKK